MKTFEIDQLFHTTWESLKPFQAIAVLRLKNLIAAGINSEEKGRFKFMLLEMLATAKGIRLLRNLSKVQVLDIVEDLSFINDLWYHFHLKSIGESKSPEEKMHDCTFNQLVFADAAYSKFAIATHQNNPDVNDYLNELIAALYCKGIFQPDNMEQHKKLIESKLTLDEKLLILHTYANIRQFIIDRCPHLFPKPKIDLTEVAEPVYTGEMWMDLRYDLAKSSVFSGLEVVKSANLYEALDYLEKESKEKAHEPTGK